MRNIFSRHSNWRILTSICLIVSLVSSNILYSGALEQSSTDTIEEPSFPLNIVLELKQDTIVYPIGEVERVENENAALFQSGSNIPITAIQYPKMDLESLEYDVTIELNPYFDEYAGFTLQISQSDDKTDIPIETGSAVEALSLTQNDILLDTQYDISVQLGNSYSLRKFTGKFTCSLDVDNTPFVDIYGFETGSQMVSRNVGTVGESEPNNTRADAQDISNCIGQPVFGTIGFAGDIDNFLIVFPNTGFLDICLEVPDGYDYDLYVYNNSMTEITHSTRVDSLDESVRINIGAGSPYII